jgi:hypothetical protein
MSAAPGAMRFPASAGARIRFSACVVSVDAFKGPMVEFVAALHVQFASLSSRNACRCGDQPAEPLRCGCFPATADLSVSVRGTPGHPPVWIDVQLLTLLDQLQMSSRGALSDVACGSAVAATHRQCWHCDEPAAPRAALQISLTYLSEEQTLRYLSTGGREWRRLHLRVCQDTQSASHPPRTQVMQ